MKRWLAMAGMSMGLVVSAWARNTPLHAKVSVDWASPGISVADALREIGTKANIEFAFDEALFEHLDPVTLTMDEVAAGRVAMRVLRPRGLTLENADGRRPRVVKDDPFREFKVQREEVFEFARKPTLTRRGDDVTIAFETKAWCDVTVAIEHADPSASSGQGGRIVRHLASGVLGLNAPEPFQWNSKAQTIVWDGKDDAGVYVDDKDAVTVRVSLGLKPRFERTLYWHPGKPASQGGYQAASGQRLLIAPAEEGVFVLDGGGVGGFDHVRLFDREGNYVRAVYPFPNAGIAAIPDLVRHRHHDGSTLPIKPNYAQTTLLKSGPNSDPIRYRDGRYQGGGGRQTFRGSAANDIAVAGNRVALVSRRLSRLGADGTSDGLNLHGPDMAMHGDKEKPLWSFARARQLGEQSHRDIRYIAPKRIAFSPDGEWLYLSQYQESYVGWHGVTLWEHRVKRMRYGSDEPPTLFAGRAEPGDEPGQFNAPADVATDAQGRVYVADHLNDRIQAFNPEGEHLASIAVKRPSKINIQQSTGDIFVFSMGMTRPGRGGGPGRLSVEQTNYKRSRFFQLTRFSSLDNGAQQKDSWDLQPATRLEGTESNMEFYPAVDTWSDPLRVWIVGPSPVGERIAYGGGTAGARRPSQLGILVLELKDGEWTVKRDLMDEAARAIVRVRPAPWWDWRLYVNPVDGMLYVGEGDSREGNTFRALLRVDPETGRNRIVELPMSTEDLAFDRDGHAYTFISDMVVRYDSQSWREIPFDYGEERARAGRSDGGQGDRATRVTSGARFPGNKGWHYGGIHVNARGDIALSGLLSVHLEARTDTAQVHAGGMYRPTMYPGRSYDPGGRFGGLLVHILDRHGRMVHSDAVPGLLEVANGTAIDANRDIYLLHAAARINDGVRHFNDAAGTLIKATPGRTRLLNDGGRIPVPLTQRPARSPDLYYGSARFWVEGAHWMAGGIGWGGYNVPDGGPCACPNARFVLDYYARSFTPEHDRYSIGVLDSAGNLIMRVGQYGNVDDGMPLVGNDAQDSRGAVGPPNPRSIGGDEVGLFDARYVGTHTDRRLFISDSGNARIVSARIGYHTNETVALKDVPDEGK